MTDPAPLLRRLVPRLALRRKLARLAILFERVWPAIWPALGVVGVFLIVALLDLPSLLPAWLHIAMLAAFGGAVAILLGLGLRGIASPNLAAADRRLEMASGLTHRPLSVLSDRPASQDEAGQALWQAHVARAAAQIRHLRIGWPKPGLARLDRRALRCGPLMRAAAADVPPLRASALFLFFDVLRLATGAARRGRLIGRALFVHGVVPRASMLLNRPGRDKCAS